jgi:hypothetical protein
MGSLHEGAKCYICKERLAGYIPDGSDGPICMGRPQCCWEMGEAHGWYNLCVSKAERCFQAMYEAQLARSAQLPQVVFGHPEIRTTVLTYLFHVIDDRHRDMYFMRIRSASGALL